MARGMREYFGATPPSGRAEAFTNALRGELARGEHEVGAMARLADFFGARGLQRRQLEHERNLQRVSQGFQTSEREASQEFTTERDRRGLEADLLLEGMRASGRAGTAAAETDRQRLIDDRILFWQQQVQRPNARKALYLPTKMSDWRALGFDELPEEQQYLEVTSRYPDVAGLGGDRSAYDARVKRLQQEDTLEVPNQLAFQRLREAILNDPIARQYGIAGDVARAVLEDIGPKDYGINLARGAKDAERVAREYRRGQIEKRIGPDTLKQTDPMAQLAQQRQMRDLAKPSGQLQLQGIEKRLGIPVDQLSPEQRNVFMAPSAVLAEQAGRMVLSDTAGVPLQGAQAGVDQLFNDPASPWYYPIRVLAKNPMHDYTPSELRGAAGMLEMLGGSGQTPEGPGSQEAPPSGTISEKPGGSMRVPASGIPRASGGTQPVLQGEPQGGAMAPGADAGLTPGMSQLQRWREAWKAQRGGKRKPRSFATEGMTDEEIARRLSGFR